MGTSIKANLLASVTSSYDPTKTTIYGRVAQKNINGIDVLGAPMSKFIDVFADTGYAPLGPIWISPNNRIYVSLTAVATGAQIALYDFVPASGAHTYRGKICVLLPNNPATTHTIRGVRVYNDTADNTGTWRVFVCTSSATTGIINAGIMCVNKVDNRDFIPGNIGALPSVGSIIPLATGTDQKAVYFMQNPSAIGANYLVSSPFAISLETSTNRIWMHRGTALLPQFSVFNAAVASLVLPTFSVTCSAATPCVIGHTGHPFKLNDQVVFSGGTMPFTSLSIGTTYYVRNPSTDAYELSLTVGGASIATSGGTASTATLSRAHGQTGSGYVGATPIQPALAGALLTTDSENNAVPVSSPLNGPVLNGQSCVSFATTTNLYLGKLSEAAASVSSVYIASGLIAPNAYKIEQGITFTAVQAGVIGNAISLVFTGSNSIDTVVNAWNGSNPTNTVAFAGRAGTYIPTVITVNLTVNVPAITFSTASAGIVTHVGHPFVPGGNEAVVISDAVGSPAVAFVYTPPTGLTLGTVYYVKYLDANSYQLSLTPGGAAINTTTTSASSVAIHLASAIAWPSLTTSNLLGALNQVTAPTALAVGYDNATDGFVFNTNVSKFISKQLVNNQIRALFGTVDNQYYEGLPDPRIVFGMAAIGGLSRRDGWLATTGTTVGQRGIQLLDMKSDDFYGYSYVITRVMTVPGANFNCFTTFEQLYDYTGDIIVYYRLGDTLADFASDSTGWIDPLNRSEEATIPINSLIQFKIFTSVQSANYSSPAQLSEFLVGISAMYEMSSSWEYSHDNSSSLSPSRVGFRLKSAYATSVPMLHFRAYDLFSSLLTHFNTATNPTYFEYSTDDGVTWVPMGTIPNVVGTLVRFNFVSPPGVKIRPSLNEI